jgi:hypothetical protein
LRWDETLTIGLFVHLLPQARIFTGNEFLPFIQGLGFPSETIEIGFARLRY